jgi:hypothetical protein
LRCAANRAPESSRSRGQLAKLRYKYIEELHANEVAILPYYVANLNIEATYVAITRDYEEFPNLCLAGFDRERPPVGIDASQPCLIWRLPRLRLQAEGKDAHGCSEGLGDHLETPCNSMRLSLPKPFYKSLK